MYKLIIRLLEQVLPEISPEIRDYLKDEFKKLKQRALDTDNKIDDIFVLIVEYILFS